MAEEKRLFEDMPELDFMADLGPELGIAPAFLEGLLKEDDWSFIIKLHSLIEAAATHLLVVTLNKPELESVISRLELSGVRTGKLAFFRNMKVLDSNSCRFIQTLSEIRNKLVHNVSNVSISLEQYVLNLKKEDQKGFNTGFRWGYKDNKQILAKVGPDKYNVDEIMKSVAFTLMEHSQYKLAIWFGSIIVLRQMNAMVSLGHVRSQIREIDNRLISFLKKLIQGDGDQDTPPPPELKRS